MLNIFSFILIDIVYVGIFLPYFLYPACLDCAIWAVNTKQVVILSDPFQSHFKMLIQFMLVPWFSDNSF